MKVSRNEWFAAFSYAAVLALGLMLAIWAAGCGSNIPIGEAPTCVDLVTDECVPEVVEEFCPPPASCDERGAYRRGFAAGVASVAPEECPVCEVCEDEDSDEVAKPHKKPHRNTRGKGHEHHDGDRIDLDSDDPLVGI